MEATADAVSAELAPQGSEDYYIARLHPPGVRERIALQLALEDRLLAGLRDARSPEAARLKLLWWRECFAAATQGEHRHPLIAALAARHPPQDATWPTAFLTASEALLERLDWQTPQPAERWLANLRAGEGGLALALALALADGQPGAPEAASLAPLVELAAATQWARGLQWLPRWQGLGLHWLPQEDLQHPALAAPPRAGGPTSREAGPIHGYWPPLAGAFAARSLGLAVQARRGLTPATRRFTLAARMRLALAQIELRLAARSGWPVLKERVVLTPFTRLLTGLAVAWFDHLPRGPDPRRGGLGSAGMSAGGRGP